jgi:CheY-like chemotaxis protein
MVKRSLARGAPVKAVEDPSTDLAGALHEVSNALMVVLGWLDAARSKICDSGVREDLQVARSHADLAYRIARTAIGARVGGDEDRSAFSVAGDVLLAVGQEARRRGVRLELDDDRVNDAMLGESRVAHQILINLMLNAVAFTPLGGTVRLSLDTEPVRMVFRVLDEGPGIDPERASTLFQASGSTRTGGAGIGLKHSAALARAHGGELRLVSCGPGACFDLSWPVREGYSGARPRPRGSGPSLAGMRVILIEDDPAVSALIEFALETHGISVEPAASQDEVVALLQDGEYDAALVDLSPFEDDASEALRLLESAAERGVSIILISGVVTRIPPEIEGRIAAWVRKPFEMNEVVQVLQQIPRRPAGKVG